MKPIHALLSLVAVGFLTISAQAEETKTTTIRDVAIVSTPIMGCNTDFAQHCKDIPATGNQRLSCLIEHEADLDTACKQGILAAALQSQLGVNKLDYAYQSCKSERTGLCGDVAAGEGRILKCLKDNQTQVSEGCITALKNTGFWDAQLEPAAGE